MVKIRYALSGLALLDLYKSVDKHLLTFPYLGKKFPMYLVVINLQGGPKKRSKSNYFINAKMIVRCI